jgi:hypothetical protein
MCLSLFFGLLGHLIRSPFGFRRGGLGRGIFRLGPASGSSLEIVKLELRRIVMTLPSASNTVNTGRLYTIALGPH